MYRLRIPLLALLSLAATATAATAAEMKVEAILAPQEQIRLDFKDGTGHFVLMVRRQGMATGSGPLAGTQVTEYGVHDITPGSGGDPRGYLVFAAPDGDTAYAKWSVRAVFVPGADGKPKLLDNGFWEIAGGTGKFAKLKGAGTLHIKPASPTDRRFILDGEVASAP